MSISVIKGTVREEGFVMTTEYTIENGRLVLPHLILAAQQRQILTYGELADKIGKHHRAIRHALGYIRDEICTPRKLPYLTAIVINQDTQLPGESFLPEGTEHLDEEAYKQAFRTHRDAVFNCQEWDALLRDLGLSPITKTADDLDEEGRIYNEVLARRGGSGEGQPHYQLKMYVAHNPARFGLYAKGDPQIEFAFVSGDKCDVVFELGELGTAVVEIKNGERGELVMGIYQAIKYRALMEAEKGHGQPHPVQAHLVAYEMPKDIEDFASQFNIKCHQIGREYVEKWISQHGFGEVN
jgi:hypothetical protein